eukprot:7376291-Prymnesium_polylepis.1
MVSGLRARMGSYINDDTNRKQNRSEDANPQTLLQMKSYIQRPSRAHPACSTPGSAASCSLHRVGGPTPTPIGRGPAEARPPRRAAAG